MASVHKAKAKAKAKAMAFKAKAKVKAAASKAKAKAGQFVASGQGQGLTSLLCRVQKCDAGNWSDEGNTWDLKKTQIRSYYTMQYN